MEKMNSTSSTILLGKKHQTTDFTYYHSTRNPSLLLPQLTNNKETDICVIGGGLTGVSVALNLAEKGHAVILLESQDIGHGASGRNGGQLVHGFSCDMDVIRKQVGYEDSKVFWGMAVEAVDEVDRRIALHKITCSRKLGYIFAATNSTQFRNLKKINKELNNIYNYEETEILEQATLKEWIRTDRYIGGLLDKGSGQLHSLNYLQGLTSAAISAGVQVFEKSEVKHVVTGNNITIQTDLGSVKAKALVLAGNAYLDNLQKTIQKKIVRINSSIGVTTKLSSRQIQKILPGNVAVADCNNVLDYFRVTPDNRLLFGAGANYLGQETKDIEVFIRQRISKLFPQLSDFDIEYAWNGFIAGTRNQIPEIGCIESNIYVAQGFSGHGLALTGLAGILISEKISGLSKRFDMFSRVTHYDMPQPPFRNALLTMVMIINKLQDRIR